MACHNSTGCAPGARAETPMLSHKCPRQKDPTTERSHWDNHRCLNSSGQCLQTSLAGRDEQRPLCVCHCFPVLNLRGGGRVTTFSIKRKVIEIHFQEGTRRPHGGVEPLIKPTQVGCQHPTARGKGDGGWSLVSTTQQPACNKALVPHHQHPLLSSNTGFQHLKPKQLRLETSTFWSGHLPKSAGKDSRQRTHRGSCLSPQLT